MISKLKSLVEKSSVLNEQEELFDLLSQMLDFNYKNRISPQNCLNHRYFSNINESIFVNK